MPIRPGRDLAPAASDYRWLLDRGYPDQGALKLVGDRYRLTGAERGMLYRGVFGRDDSSRRASRIVDRADLARRGPASTLTSELTVDGHNVLFTIWNTLAGRPVVLATDGFVRDIGGTRARLPRDERFARIATMLCAVLAKLPIRLVRIVLDDPLPWSRDHASRIERIWAGLETRTAAQLTAGTSASVDSLVAATEAGMIATSDTAIIDRCLVPVLDLGGLVVRGDSPGATTGAQPIVMGRLIAAGPAPQGRLCRRPQIR